MTTRAFHGLHSHTSATGDNDLRHFFKLQETTFTFSGQKQEREKQTPCIRGREGILDRK